MISINGMYKCFLRYRNEKLISFKMDSALSDDAISILHKVIPFDEKSLIDLPQKIKNLTISETVIDTSFNAFWDRFNNKVGNKIRAEKIHKLLSTDEKLQVILSIKRYHNWLIQNPNVQQLYPETYLSQRRWENKY